MANHSFRVLSVQSHVVSGYVGNKSACFPLQLLEFDVDFVNSVQFSNHTGYKNIKGQVLTSGELETLYDGLVANDLLKYSHVLTGYVGNVTFLTKLTAIIKDLKKAIPDLCFVCDPVMGDDGKWYVPQEVLSVYKDELISIADIITPNQFEAELLTDIKIDSKESALQAINVLHQKGVKTVIISSVQLDSADDLLLLGSSICDDKISTVTMKIPTLHANFTGSGDVFSALILAWMAKTGGDLKESCEKTINSLHCILKRTLECANGKSDPFSLELKLIQSKEDIENPPSILKSEK